MMETLVARLLNAYLPFIEEVSSEQLKLSMLSGPHCPRQCVLQPPAVGLLLTTTAHMCVCSC